MIITFGAIHTRQSTGLTGVMAVTANGEYFGHISAEILFKVNYFYDHCLTFVDFCAKRLNFMASLRPSVNPIENL